MREGPMFMCRVWQVVGVVGTGSTFNTNEGAPAGGSCGGQGVQRWHGNRLRKLPLSARWKQVVHVADSHNHKPKPA